MKFCMYVNQITPHLMPLAREMVKRVGLEEVRYVYDKDLENERNVLGWSERSESWVINKNEQPDVAEAWLRNSEILICERRDLDLWEMRTKGGRGMFYTSERWFKPFAFGLPGWLRLLNPSFFNMARRAIRLFDQYSNLVYLCDGYYAAQDFVKLARFMHGNLFALLLNPKIEFEAIPMGRVTCDRQDVQQLRMWGYYVAPSTSEKHVATTQYLGEKVKILWVGRYLDWKHVDTIIKAALVNKTVVLNLYGAGPAERRLRELARGCDRISFHLPVAVEEVRSVMREHDVYVLSSDEYEGWGAVVNEALEEGMTVVGTYEAGASRTLLPEECLFHFWDWKRLSRLFHSPLPRRGIGSWSVKLAAKRIADG